jgi:hypothetical protein
MATGIGVRLGRVVLIAGGCAIGCASTKPATIPHTNATARAAEPARKPQPAPEKLASVYPPVQRNATETASRPSDAQAVQAMRHAISLYEQFLERAQGDPDMKEAIARSRERIEELRQTIAVIESWR